LTGGLLRLTALMGLKRELRIYFHQFFELRTSRQNRIFCKIPNNSICVSGPKRNGKMWLLGKCRTVSKHVMNKHRPMKSQTSLFLFLILSHGEPTWDMYIYWRSCIFSSWKREMRITQFLLSWKNLKGKKWFGDLGWRLLWYWNKGSVKM